MFQKISQYQIKKILILIQKKNILCRRRWNYQQQQWHRPHTMAETNYLYYFYISLLSKNLALSLRRMRLPANPQRFVTADSSQLDHRRQCGA